MTPVLTLNPRAHNAWEETAGFDAVVAIAEAADRLGWHHVTCSEHVAVPQSVAPTRGSRFLPPKAILLPCPPARKRYCVQSLPER